MAATFAWNKLNWFGSLKQELMESFRWKTPPLTVLLSFYPFADKLTAPLLQLFRPTHVSLAGIYMCYMCPYINPRHNDPSYQGSSWIYRRFRNILLGSEDRNPYLFPIPLLQQYKTIDVFFTLSSMLGFHDSFPSRMMINWVFHFVLRLQARAP